MVEDIGKIISNGIETYTKNINLSIPFVLNTIVTGLLAVILLFGGFLYIFGSSLSALKNITAPEQIFPLILPIISQHLSEIVILIIFYFLITVFFQSFFMAGAIGMAQKAMETGRAELSIMTESGKKNVVNLYLAEILVGLLVIAGIVFVVPGAIKIDMGQPSNTWPIILLVAGVFLWILYIIVLSLVLSIFSYALVIENLGPMDGITTGIEFFRKNKMEVFLLWLIIGIIVIAITVVGEITRFIPVMNIIWSIINFFISVFIFPPLTTLWWVRLYMTRTDKKIYFNELLAHPNDLEKFKAN